MENPLISSQTIYRPRMNGLLDIFAENIQDAEMLAGQLHPYGYSCRIFTSITELDIVDSSNPPSARILWVSKDWNNIFDQLQKSDRINGRSTPIITVCPSGNWLARLQSVQSGGIAFFSESATTNELVDALDRILHPQIPVPYRVLLVEKNAAQVSLFEEMLKRVGMETQHVVKLESILSVLSEFNPDLILIEMNLDECSGLELARVIRQMEEFVSVPIVFLSNILSRDQQLAALFAGGDDVITLPIQPEHFIASVALKVERYRKLRTLMLSDSLTGLFNHTMVKERLNQEVIRARRERKPLAYAMLDIDHFKEVNDLYGHAAGDRVLKSLARLLKQRLRRTDVIGRYGGEEFAILFPNTTVHEAKIVVEDIRESFSIIKHRVERECITCYFSAGIASYPDCQTAVEISLVADRALYDAKNNGRNQVVVGKHSQGK